MTAEIQSTRTFSPVTPGAQSLEVIRVELAKLKAPRGWFECKRYVILEGNTLVCRSLYWSEFFGYWRAGTTAKIADIANFYHRPDFETPIELEELFARYLSKKVNRRERKRRDARISY